MTNQLTRKQPRDFVAIDELWPAADGWPQYYPAQTVWVFMDEYRAELPGDEDYVRIIISGGDHTGWQYSRPLAARQEVQGVLSALCLPISEQQLQRLGFKAWG